MLGRYAYSVSADKIIYFGREDLCVSIYNLMKLLSEFPLGYYEGLEIFIDVDMADEYIKDYVPDLEIFILGILIILGIIFAFSWKQYHFVYNYNLC